MSVRQQILQGISRIVKFGPRIETGQGKVGQNGFLHIQLAFRFDRLGLFHLNGSQFRCCDGLGRLAGYATGRSIGFFSIVRHLTDICRFHGSQ